ncbi:Zn-dependent hydrolase, beta-lactamase family [Teredinibacter turnerae T7901]|uniref:Zn-dependent hydrolase, beta-lactamase family n=1 Tax=Teredinibacter turnerae (strain ATCC 39867 / T7901) TaxID=377629 RepID=C5BI33_TERTT|nr:MBL fold metallo-hydrolase [Teredinibacter turnerae]ACR11600.1 Zn-dependent hydrolase, beta-lactamase family [Teredinibacter turnerae T7901]
MEDPAIQKIKQRQSKGKFLNSEPVSGRTIKKTLQIFLRFLTEKRINTEPSSQIPVVPLTANQLEQLPEDQLFIIKLGHSSLLLKVYGEIWLIDPVFGERASPFAFMGPKRFHPTPIDLKTLPFIDRVLISHNHYDHLDKTTIRALANRVGRFYVPVGVDQTLIKWGGEPGKISCFNWWQEEKIQDGFIAFTPTRHFSGRGLSDADKTLWGAWVIETGRERLYFSGDSGYFAGFANVGEKYGPFDLAFIETGAYDSDWPDVHMTPEQSLQAYRDVRGLRMMPIHNGTFDLAFHPWYEPMERIFQLAKRQPGSQPVPLCTPVFGEAHTLESLTHTKPWWQPLMAKQQQSKLADAKTQKNSKR